MASKTFDSLRILNFRRFFLGALFSNLGTWIKNVAQSWLVLTVLTDNSSLALGYVTALQFVAIPVLSAYGGALADRFNKRNILLITQILLGIFAVVTYVLVATNMVELWHIYLIAFLEGVVVAFDAPARQVIISEIVPDELVPNAVGLSSMSFNGARLVGPAVAGVLIGLFDIALVLLLNAITFVFMFIALLALRVAEINVTPPVARKGAVLDGLRYIVRHADLLVLLVIVFFFGAFGLNFQIFNALMARQEFGLGPEYFGLLGTIMAVGAFGAALLSARRKRPRLKMVLGSVFLFSLFLILAGSAPTYLLYASLLIPCGFFALNVIIACNVAIQMGAEREYRGRVMAIYMAVFSIGSPLGSVIVGWVGNYWGARFSVMICGAFTLLCALGVLLYFVIWRGLRLHFKYEHYLLRLEAVWIYADSISGHSGQLAQDQRATLPSEN